MRPLRSFLILLIFLACFTGLYYILPEGGLFPPVNEFIPEGSASLAKSLAGHESADALPDDRQADTVKLPVTDTLTVSDSINNDPLNCFRDNLKDSSHQVRIIYYGDSQIEGDRFTSYMRHYLQTRYAGTGPGLFLPLMPVMYTKSIVIKSSDNWKKYNYLSYRNKELTHNRLGPFMALCRFLPEGYISDEIVTATINITPSVFADSLSSRYDRLRIFYTAPDGPVALLVKAGGDYICREPMLKTRDISEIKCDLAGASKVSLEFTGKVSPEIYGISIESDNGVIVDNIPQRGSAGLEFTMTDSAALRKSFSLIEPDLFILQYGLNIVRNVREEYGYYQLGLQRQIALLHKVAPGVPVVVAGVTDMAAGKDGEKRSFSNIPAIIRAQKTATEAAGAIFWDAYSAMGGDSSIIRWSEHKPALAQKDLVHFTYAGADTLSKRFVEYLFPQEVPEHEVVASPLKLTATDSVLRYAHLQSSENSHEGLFPALSGMIFRYDPDRPMIFTTPGFWFFLLLVLAGYGILYRKKFLRNLYLMLISLFFYFKSGGLFLILLLLVTLTDYACGILMHRSQSKIARRVFVLLSIISNIGLLAYFKYSGFFVSVFNDLFGTGLEVNDYLASFSNSVLGTSFDISSIILPVGISFFTFQSLSYTLDVYRKRMEPVRNIIDFGFYVSFFPQLVAGPIIRASEFIPQLYADYSLSTREFSHALFLISKGLIKKIIISDFIAVNFVDRVFDAPSLFSGFENLMAVYGYGLQIYCDFSGYTDIAIGLGLVLGFRFPVNFNSPYKASDLSDFWKRWHISLSRWLKDYLYIPLGGNRKGRIRTGINLMVTMLLGGLWHGAAMKFVIWGGLHGLGLSINRLWQGLTKGRFTDNRFMHFISVFITFNFVSFCWIFFRAPDMESVRIMLGQMWSSFSPGSYMTVLPSYASVFLLTATGYFIHFLPETVKESYRGLFIKSPVIIQFAIIFLIAFLLYQMRSTDVMPFIYFRF